MWLQAILTRDDLAAALERATPVRVDLQGKGWLEIDRPTEVDLVPERGLRAVTSARLSLEVLGVTVPVTIKSATVMLRPEIARRERDGRTHEALRFALDVEQVDIAALPGVLDRGVAAVVNRMLHNEHVVWDYLQTLDFTIPLPQLEPATSLELFAQWGEVRIGAEGFALALSFGVDFTHAGQEPEARDTDPGEAPIEAQERARYADDLAKWAAQGPPISLRGAMPPSAPTEPSVSTSTVERIAVPDGAFVDPTLRDTIQPGNEDSWYEDLGPISEMVPRSGALAAGADAGMASGGDELEDEPAEDVRRDRTG